MKRTITGVLVTSVSLCCLMQAGCGTNKALSGGAIGATGGAVVGGIIGHQFDNKVLGAIIGAAVGGTAGSLIGRHMDKQAEEMRRDLEGAKVERVGEGIKITFDSGILFDSNKSELRSQAKENIDKLAVILLKYPDTNILVAGHTDASGSDEYNQKLSESRANTVANYAKGRGVEGARFTVVGYGESDPVASNDTPQGMQQNRRVEIAIFANEKMKKAAENGTL